VTLKATISFKGRVSQLSACASYNINYSISFVINQTMQLMTLVGNLAFENFPQEEGKEISTA